MCSRGGEFKLRLWDVWRVYKFERVRFSEEIDEVVERNWVDAKELWLSGCLNFDGF